MKWLNEPTKSNSWEPKDELLRNCTQLVEVFENPRALDIIGMKITDNGDVHYAVFSTGGFIDLIASDEVIRRWPDMLEKYFLSRVKFTMVNHEPYRADAVVESKVVVFMDENLPSQILGCTDHGGINFWCQFENGDRKILSVFSKLFTESEPFQKLVLQSMESKIITDPNINQDLFHVDFHCEYYYHYYYLYRKNECTIQLEKFIRMKICFIFSVTRHHINSLNFDRKKLVLISRNLTLDRFAFRKLGTVPARRHTRGPSILKVVTNVPAAIRRARAKSQSNVGNVAPASLAPLQPISS